MKLSHIFAVISILMAIAIVFAMDVMGAVSTAVAEAEAAANVALEANSNVILLVVGFIAICALRWFRAFCAAARKKKAWNQ